MKNIGIIIDDITLKAGTERAVANLCNGLLNYYPKDYKITIISIFSNSNDQIFFSLHNDVKIHHLNCKKNTNKLSKIFWYFSLIKKLKKVIIQSEFKVVLGTTYIHNILLPIISNGSIKIGCEHEVYDYPSKPIIFVRKYLYKGLNKLVVLNNTEKERYSFLNNVKIIPNIITFKNTSISNITSKNIIAVGRLTYQKGFDLLVQIADIVVKQHPDWIFNIYGDGEDKEKLQALINEKQLQNNVILNGAIVNIDEKYIESSIFVLTSRWESFGLVLIEAMNFGLPLVSFNCVGPKNLIKEAYNGFIIQANDTVGFANKINYLIDNLNVRAQMGKNALECSKEFEDYKIIPLWHQLIQK